MRLFAVRPVASLLFALMLAFGLGGQGAFAASMSGKMQASAAMGMPDGADCQGCGGDHAGMAMGACVAVCVGVVALPSAFIAVPNAAGERLMTVAEADGDGHSGPPDPFPPRSIVLN